ncbi:MAG: family 16 glycoside hydrolase, partial [Pirellulaceae bacterium]
MHRITVIGLKKCLVGLLCVASWIPLASVCSAEPPQGFTSLFDGKSFAGWVLPEADNGHWKIVDGVIDYDAASEAKGDKNLWTEKEYGDFILKM